MSSHKLVTVNIVSPEVSSHKFLNENEFAEASRETIFGVVSELLNSTVKNFSDENVSNSPLHHKGKQKINETSSYDHRDLPRRRSSRIQSKTTVKKDETVKKRKKTKQEDSSFIDVESVDEEMEVNKETENSESNSSSSPSMTAAKNETNNCSKKPKDSVPKTQKTQKRPSKKVEKKEDTKSSEKLKPERKRATSRKKKQEVLNPDIAMEDTNEKTTKPPDNTIFKNIIKENSTPSSNITRAPFIKTHESSSIEKTLDAVIFASKPDEDKSNETNDPPSEPSSLKPVKVKSRWWRSSELEGVLKTEPVKPALDSLISTQTGQNDFIKPLIESTNLKVEELKSVIINPKTEVEDTSLKENTLSEAQSEPVEECPLYEHIEDNIYKFERKKSKSKKQVRRMICDCTLTKEELECGVLGCKEECLNRLLMIECGYRCPIGEACSNKKFQKKENAKTKIFKAEQKGWGLKASENISGGDFLMEFVGEVLNHKEYRQRVKQYSKDKNIHHYFMALKTDEILDATMKGNHARFINHSCDPNCETQKWTVNGELRVGVFSRRSISAGEELTLDYKFQRYGREAQKCLCGSYNCSGYIGGNKQISIDAYSASKGGIKNKKKGVEDKKRDWEDLTLEEEIEKLGNLKGLRNKEETIKFARLMVRADDNTTRHQLLDIIIKTEEQACLRLFLDYHGLPLLWSWMTDVVDLDLKTKILQVLQLLPISNKTMLLDSKVMSIVEKWVQECDIVKKEDADTKFPLSDFSLEGSSDYITKKVKMSDFSDSETDSSGSHPAIDSDNKSFTAVASNLAGSSAEEECSKADFSPSDLSLSDSLSEAKLDISSELNVSVEATNIMRKDISSLGSELLCAWKNLKEVFRIPRLELQKRRKEDEREADHSVMSRVQVDVRKPEIEMGNQIQVLIAGKTSNNVKRYDYDSPDSYKHEHSHRKPLLKASGLNKPIRRATEDLQQNLDEDPPLDSESPILSNVSTSPILQHNCKPALHTIPTFLSQPPVNFPPPVLPSTAQPPPIKIAQPMFPQIQQQIVYPTAQSQVNILNTAVPPPNLALPPTNMPPPTTLLTKQYPPPLLQQPPPNIPPSVQTINTSLPPISTNYILPPSVPPVSVVPQPSQFMANQTVPVTNYPPTPTPLGSQSQSFYYMQQPPAITTPTLNTNFSETIPIQSISSIPVQCATTPSIQPNALPMQSVNVPQVQPSNPVPLSSNVLPVQSITTLPIHSGLPLSNTLPFQEPSPVIEETKPVKLPKNWRSATDSEGNTYYYHSITRVTQWDPPTADQGDDEGSEEEEEDSASEDSESSDTPTYDEPKVSIKHSRRKSKKRKTTKAAADTSVSFPVRPEIAKKIKELFRTKMSSFIVQCLNHYRKPECKVGRITNNDDFKYLARKLTHYIMMKEIKQLKNVEDLDCNETVTYKAKDFIKKYMSKYGAKYNRKEKSSPS